jgi:drug/metabolite transporter (DMT)-like permease
MSADRRRPRLGYLLAAVAAAMFAVNGSIAKFLLDDGVSAAHLSQLRVTVSFALLAGALALVDRGRLRIARADVPRRAWLGLAGVAIVQFSYFLAIERLPISVALVIQFTGPLMVLLWLRAVHGRRLRLSLYGAVALSVAGSALVVRVYDAGSIDGLGVAFALVAAVTFAIYLEALAAVQIAGGLLVVAAVAWVQTHPPAREVEAVPAWGVGRARLIGRAAGR